MALPRPIAMIEPQTCTSLQRAGHTKPNGPGTQDFTAEPTSLPIQHSISLTSSKPSRPMGPSPAEHPTPSLEAVTDTANTNPSLLKTPFRPLYAPAVPSPLNPISPAASFTSKHSTTGSSEEQPSNESGSATLSRTGSNNPLGNSAGPGRPPIPSPWRGKRKPLGPGCRQHRQASPKPRLYTPLSLSDLGRDYSRYPLRHQKTPEQALPSIPPPPPRAVIRTETRESLLPEPLGSQNVFAISSKSLPIQIGPQHDLTFLDDRFGAPGTAECGYNFPIYINEKEDDDDLHMPYPDDDIRFKPKLKEYLSIDRLCPFIGGLIVILGLTGIFLILPILTYTGVARFGSPSDKHPNDIEGWAYVNDVKYPLLSNIRTGLIDPTTPKSAMKRRGIDGDGLELVFSDEFNGRNRTFYPGDDPFWTAPDMWYGATQDLEWYDPDAVTTEGGTLNLQLDNFINHGLQYRSGMLNSWNQICFKGGALEVSISLAGPAGTPGLWPGAWTMGNLGRPGYKATTEGVWPYTYNSCDAGITPNQSSPDGLSHLPGQKLSSCVCPGADHPTPGTGRGAPEIDVIEASVDPTNRLGVVTQSYQVAPFDVWYRPNYDFLEIPNYNTTQMNAYCGGPFQEAISGTTLLNKAWYDGNRYQRYAFEYSPGTGSKAQIGWFVGEEMSYRMTGDAIGPNGNIKSRIISEEPMSIILNLGFSTAWTQIDYPNLKFPTIMRVDYVRWYQKPGQTSVTCDPEGYETTEYIKTHPKAYYNYNLTVRHPSILV